MPQSVAIIDSGGANINSVVFALERLGVRAQLTCDADFVKTASHVILPGVGSAGAAMSRLNQNGLDEVVPKLTQPVLGICLGMQLLFDSSEEENTACLGIIDGIVQKLPLKRDLTVPHMGWNKTIRVGNHRLLSEIESDFFAYFVHSYVAPICQYTIGKCQHGDWFSSIVAKQNFLGIQFHPERSGNIGLGLLKRFLTLEKEVLV